jgi:hypothetical protein
MLLASSHMKPVPQLTGSQQISPEYPHATHIPPTQLFGSSHGYGNTVGSVQQISPRAPHEVQLPPWHVRPLPHVVPQHG